MTDRYQQFATSGVGRFVVRRLGLPNPTPLRRYRPGEPPLPGPALLGGAPGGRLADTLVSVLKSAGIDVRTEPVDTHGALVFDATGIANPTQLRELHAFFRPVIRSLASC
ncbi:MAG TPA: short chain dehydrogenase, partial [Actinophytocola sp.]|nr:short chain dehydrogenase [Actinophytocola sp.]